MRMKKIFAIICLCCGLSMTAAAQCGIENTAFKSGELLSYDLYFNWKFIWMKVGSAEMDTRLSRDGYPTLEVRWSGSLEVLSDYTWQSQTRQIFHDA